MSVLDDEHMSFFLSVLCVFFPLLLPFCICRSYKCNIPTAELDKRLKKKYALTYF